MTRPVSCFAILALLAAPDASPAARHLADLLVDFCNAAEGRAVA